jgi:hypothetical protein
MIWQIFRGIAILFGSAIVVVAAIFTTLDLVLEIGVLYTALIYVLTTLAVTIGLIGRQIKRYGAGVRTLVQYDPDLADQEGSTARYGRPHDHNFFMPRWLPRHRPPPNPEWPEYYHKPPKGLL